MQKYKIRISKDNPLNVDIDANGYLKAFGVTMQYSRGDALKKAEKFGGKIAIGEKHNRGECPKCNQSNLEYVKDEANCDQLFFEYVCRECEHEGYEVFDMIFAGHEVKTYFNEQEVNAHFNKQAEQEVEDCETGGNSDS